MGVEDVLLVGWLLFTLITLFVVTCYHTMAGKGPGGGRGGGHGGGGADGLLDGDEEDRAEL